MGDYASDEADATLLLRNLQERLQKYQFMELTTTSRIRGLLDKIPDMRKSLEMVKFLAERKDAFDTRYELNDTVYAEATVPPTDKVFLWLGANVMLEYNIPEAEELLQSKLDGAMSSVDQCKEDLEFLRENITTMEVNTARVINWQVEQRKLAAK